MGLFKYCLTGIAEFYAKSTPYNSPVLQRAIKYSIPATVYCSLSPGLILTCVMAHWLRVNKAWNRPQSLFGSLQCFFLRPNLPFVSEKWQPRSTVKAGGCEKQTLEKLMGVCWRGKLDFPSTAIAIHLTPHTAGGRGWFNQMRNISQSSCYVGSHSSAQLSPAQLDLLSLART